MEHDQNMPSVLFVCLGNICRSPLAEAAFRQVAGEDWEVDSAGTGNWHAGHPPDPRSISVAKANGVDISHYRARQIKKGDFERFDHIIAMDMNNFTDLQNLQPPESLAQISMLLNYVEGRDGHSVEDPYYGDAKDFERCWNDVTQGAQGLLVSLTQKG